MCGIVGMVGADVFGTTVKALGRLEYRGYDSYGFAYRREDGVAIIKSVGPIGDAISSDSFAQIRSNQVLSHTRWATHGGVTEINAHPHISFDGRIAIVHNGVIENYRALRRELANDGISCLSETDSEVIAHLIALNVAVGLDILNAIAGALSMLVGEYALGIIDTSDPATIYGARYKGPLLAATNGTNGILASDPVAVTNCTQITYLEDGDIVRIEKDRFTVYQRAANEGVREVARPASDHEDKNFVVSKDGFDHFMLKEIYEIPAALRTILSLTPKQFQGHFKSPTARTAIVGAGSAFYVSMIGQYFLAELSRETVTTIPADEAANLLCLQPDDCLITISQSGETYDTLEAVRIAARMGASIISICNVPGSSLERLATRRIQQGSGTEVCVLSTKSIISQVAIMLRIALERGLENRSLSEVRYDNFTKALQYLPDRLESFIGGVSSKLQALAKEICDVTDWFFIGRGVLYPAALESALKFKEVSYHHAEGMSAGFLKHGTISLIRKEFFTVALLPSPASDDVGYQATLSAVSEIVARGGPVIGIGPSNAHPDDLIPFQHYIGLDYIEDGVTDVFFQLVTGQLLAYYCALQLGRNIDRPRGLAKSVTVR